MQRPAQRRIVTLLVTFACAWAGVAALYSQAPAPPRVGCKVDQQQITTGGSTRFVIFVDQLPPLTAYSLTLSYDSNALQLQDQDATTLDVINLAPGSAFPSTSVSQNVVNSLTGQIQIAVSQPISSSLDGNFDEIATGTISAIKDTVAIFHFTDVILYDHNAQLMNIATYGIEDCFVQIGNTGSPTPAPTATYYLSPLLTATPLPPGVTSVAPTGTPTATETETFTPGPTSPLPTPTDTETPTFTPSPATPLATDTPIPTETPSATVTETPTAIQVIISTPETQPGESQTPPETPTPAGVETPVPIETSAETPTETEVPTDLPTNTPEPTATDTVTPTPEPATATATAIRPPTPTVVAQIDRNVIEAIETVTQTDAPLGAERQQPYRLLAIAALFGAFTLLLIFWLLRRRGNE